MGSRKHAQFHYVGSHPAAKKSKAATETPEDGHKEGSSSAANPGTTPEAHDQPSLAKYSAEFMALTGDVDPLNKEKGKDNAQSSAATAGADVVADDTASREASKEPGSTMEKVKGPGAVAVTGDGRITQTTGDKTEDAAAKESEVEDRVCSEHGDIATTLS